MTGRRLFPLQKFFTVLALSRYFQLPCRPAFGRVWASLQVAAQAFVQQNKSSMGDELAELKAEVKRLHAKLQKVEGKTSYQAK
jgi:hypothetical protein